MPPPFHTFHSDTLGDMMTDTHCWCCGQGFDLSLHVPDSFLVQLVAEQFGTDRGPMCKDCEFDFYDWYSSETVDLRRDRSSRIRTP